MLVTITNNGKSFVCTAKQAAALEVLMDTNGGGFATIKGYVSTSDRVKPETADINFISRFSTEKLYQRKIDALEGLTIEEVMSDLRDHPKIKALTVDELYETFDARKKSEIDSLNKTLEGDRDDNRRASHDRNYHTLTNGVKVNFVTEKNKEDGQSYPVLDEASGLPVVGSILIYIIEVSRHVIEPGEYKVVNNGAPVLISKALNKHLPKSSKIKALTLKEDNFVSLTIGNETLVPSQFKGL